MQWNTIPLPSPQFGIQIFLMLRLRVIPGQRDNLSWYLIYCLNGNIKYRNFIENLHVFINDNVNINRFLIRKYSTFIDQQSVSQLGEIYDYSIKIFYQENSFLKNTVIMLSCYDWKFLSIFLNIVWNVNILVLSLFSQ